MFEASLITLLAADSALTTRITTFGASPAIFSDYAPEEAELPYIVFDIEENETDSLIIDEFDIEVDIYGLRTAAKTIREIVERVVFVCDRTIITGDSRFTTIRLYRGNNRLEPVNNSKTTCYTVRLSARGTRKKWADTISR